MFMFYHIFGIFSRIPMLALPHVSNFSLSKISADEDIEINKIWPSLCAEIISHTGLSAKKDKKN